MAQAIEPKHLAKAAAEGVARALTSRREGTGAGAEKFEELQIPHKIICGIPAYLFEVAVTEHNGTYTVGEPQPTTLER